jgi:hypothetical protein
VIAHPAILEIGRGPYINIIGLFAARLPVRGELIPCSAPINSLFRAKNTRVI